MGPASLVVRLGGPADIDAAASVFLRSNQARRGGEPTSPERIERVMARLGDPAYWFLVAEDAGLPIAMACAGPARADDGVGALILGTCFLGYVYVVPQRWGQGIGGFILDAMIEEARRRGFHRIELFTHEADNERAHGLYLSRGFEPTGEVGEDEQGTRIGRWAREADMPAD